MDNGYRLQFFMEPIPWRTKPLKSPPMEQSAINVAVEKFLEASIFQKSTTQADNTCRLFSPFKKRRNKDRS
ncbi:hypothetical protein BY458DRAFT_573684 [Sporodiniella umbellata]|nr:hypothetical protein BY458DRAFT_573684 [Sporodiniella umbellata]